MDENKPFIQEKYKAWIKELKGIFMQQAGLHEALAIQFAEGCYFEFMDDLDDMTPQEAFDIEISYWSD